MDSITTYSFASLAWLSLQAVPLIIWPRFISSMLAADSSRHATVAVNAIEQYYARSLGFSQLAIGLLLVVLSGALPLTSMVDTPADAVSPYANAVLLVSMFYHATSAGYGYLRFNHSGGQIGYLLGSLGSAALAAFGLWIIMFAHDQKKLSKKTGADKRTSGFPFKNAEADKRNVRMKDL